MDSLKVNTLRTLEKSDIKECLDIIKLNYGEDYSSAELELTAAFQNIWIRPHFLVLVNDEDKILAFGGICQTSINRRCYGIYCINTHPEHMKKGYGETIIIMLLQHLKKANTYNQVWVILTCRLHLKKFYERFGFKVAMDARPEDQSLLMGAYLSELIK